MFEFTIPRLLGTPPKQGRACSFVLFFPPCAACLPHLSTPPSCCSARGLAHRSADTPCSMPTICLILHPPQTAAHSHPLGLMVPTAEPGNSRVSGDWGGVWKRVVISRWAHPNFPVDSLLTWRGTARRGARIGALLAHFQGHFCFCKSGPFGMAGRQQKISLILQS